MNTTTLNDRDEAIIADYNANQRIAQIAERHGVTESVVQTVIRSNRHTGKITRAPRSTHDEKVNHERNARIVEMYHAGSTLNNIGEYFGITRERVRQILSNSGTERRDMTEHTEVTKTKLMAIYGPMIDASFDEHRSITKVVNEFRSTVPVRWVRQHLEPRRNEVLRTNSTPPVWSNDQIIDILREASQGRGKLSISDYQKWRTQSIADRRPPTHSVISWRFGSWRNAVALAGLADNAARREYARRWSRDDAMEAVATYAREAKDSGERPTFSGYDTWSRKHGWAPSAAYVRHLTGLSWSQILRSVLTRQPA